MSGKNLYLGAAYYPEVNYFETLDEDIKYMLKAGLNVMRLGEFAWSVMEPTEGSYDFEWLKKVVNKLYENGIYSILCTPTNTPPIWLTRKHPEILRRDDDGRDATHGGRGHGCPNSPVFNKYVNKIVTKIGQTFANHPAVIGWQIDNEIYPWQQGCHCDFCMEKFHKRLAEKFGTIDKLNYEWALRIWSIEYQEFSQIEYPKIKEWGSHPSVKTEYINFQVQSNADYISRQADILRNAGINVPIGTDMMPIGSQDHVLTNKNLDVVMLNHYHSKNNFYESAFWMDYLSGIKDRPFWNTETATTANGAASVNPSPYPVDYNYINTMLPFAFGGEMNLYWLYRAHPAGPELMHSSVITAQGKPVHVFGEIIKARQTLDKCKDFLTALPLKPNKFAMSFSSFAWNMFEGQKIAADFHYFEFLMEFCYKPLFLSDIKPHIHNPQNPLDNIAVLYSPFLISLEEDGFADKLGKWIIDGGTWIAGPLTDIRNQYCGKYRKSVFGLIERLTGIENIYQIPATSLDNELVFEDNSISQSYIWNDVFNVKAEHKVLARYKSKSQEINGHAAIVSCRVGKGKIVVLGAMPDEKSLIDIIKNELISVDIKPQIHCSPDIIAIAREGGGKKGYCIAELFCEQGFVTLDKEYIDIESGETVVGKINIEPYAFKCLEQK